MVLSPASDELTLKGVLGDTRFQRSSMLKELRYVFLFAMVCRRSGDRLEPAAIENGDVSGGLMSKRSVTFDAGMLRSHLNTNLSRAK